MKIWVDDIRPAPHGYVWCRSVDETKNTIVQANADLCKSHKEGHLDMSFYIEEISLDHDAGDYFSQGGDYIRILDWLEWLYQGQRCFIEFHLHSQNPVGVQNMRRIIEKNKWIEKR